MPLIGKKKYTRHRYAAGQWSQATKGYFESPAPATDVVEIAVQPLQAEEAQFLPEGVSVSDGKKGYTKSALRTHDEATQTPADVVDIDGELYRVHKVFDFGSGLLAHYKVVLIRDQRGMA
jgi:hypothetical protein